MLRNDAYLIKVVAGGDLEIHRTGVPAVRHFAARFTVLASDQDPQLRYERAQEEAYLVPSWKCRSGGRCMDLFQAAETESMQAAGATVAGGIVRWRFPDGKYGSLEAKLELPPGSSDPRLRFRFTPKADGWYSIGYTGAPSVAPSEVESLWQSLIWQERRFPRMSFLSTERMCSLPVSIVTSGGVSVAVAADPEEVPFRIPSFSDTRFGVLLRNAEGLGQPMLFAPVLGHPFAGAAQRDANDDWRYGKYPPAERRTGLSSHMRAGQPFSFRVRLLMGHGNWYPMFRHVAQQLYRFHDYRQNVATSLNETLENMVAYAMDDIYSGWVDDLKGFDYTTDVAGTVKVVSALHPLAVALITDNREIFRRRALPVVEYLMSREKYLFSVREDITNQNPSHFLRGPAAEVSELAALYLMSGGRSSVFRHFAETLNGKPRALNLLMVSEGRSWQNALALYRMTGSAAYLEEARRGADRYIAERIDHLPTDFSDVHVAQGGQFWTDFAPKWIDLFELYEETQEPRYLKAAASGAREYASFAWLQPAVPNADVVINPHNQVAVHNGRRDGSPMRAPEQRVPAWRVSPIGLVPEASTTYASNSAVFLAHHAAYMLRIAALVKDPFLHDVARSAIVGRYANFPGYKINGEFTTVYERPDYPLRPFHELTYNQIYFNHVWPHIALLYDYLISDVYTRSQGRIDFPSRYAQGYAYLQSKVYGDRTGTFYGRTGVRLWMPAKLLRIDTPQINYVSAYDGGNLYLMLSNQSSNPVTARILVNPDLVPYQARQTYTVETWRDNQRGPATVMKGGELTVPVAGQGLTAVAIAGVKVLPQFQQDVFARTAPLSEKSFTKEHTPCGDVTGMLLSFGRGTGTAYIWLDATERQLTSTRLRYRIGSGDWKAIEDNRYPYDFSISIPDGEREFSYSVEGVTPGGAVLKTNIVELRQ